ncbi:DNA polymerase [Haloferula sp. A504]|uniref:DNA polymerase n=1 Tax=Haloferula sp. A504 TaxID=3373601 RepID=UPI0031C39AB7|nr:DNA polymerase [Verrucomicrobiaceae bacterium E54]
MGEACRIAGIKPPPSLAEDDPGCEAWERQYGESYPWVGAMRDWRKANALLEKLKVMRARTRPTDGCMGYGLKYFGGHTGRWSGDAGWNIHNLPRGEMFGVDLRGCVIPRPGHRLVACDLSQIEPRVMAWLCGDHAFLDQLAHGTPLYEAHARRTMGWDGGDLKTEDPDRYALAKARVLGLGYGCGPAKFGAIAKTMCGIDLSEREAQATVAAFRSSNRGIVALWNRLQTDCRRAARDGTFEIELPSGRRLAYYNVRSTGGWTFQTERGGRVQRFYGGRLAENLVQATARDVFAEGLLRIERAGIPIAFHCHDEVVCEVPADTAAEAATEIARLMTTPPEWMPDIPLAASTQTLSRYAK